MASNIDSGEGTHCEGWGERVLDIKYSTAQAMIDNFVGALCKSQDSGVWTRVNECKSPVHEAVTLLIVTTRQAKSIRTEI